MLLRSLAESAAHFWWPEEFENMENPDFKNLKHLQNCTYYGMEDGARQGPDETILGTTLGSAGKIKLGYYEGSELVSSYGSFDGTNGDNLEGLVPGDGDPLGIVEGTGYGKILSKLDGVVCD